MGRLADVEEHFENYLRETGLSPKQYLDVGVSSGIITWDWCRKLKQSGRHYEMVATDLLFRSFLVPVAPGLKVRCMGVHYSMTSSDTVSDQVARDPETG